MNRNQEVEVLWGAWSQDPRANRKAQAARPRLKEAKSDSCGSTNRNRVEGAASQGERAIDREALATKGGRRRRGDRAAKATESYLGRSRLVPERATPMRRSEKSAEAVVAVRGAEQGEPPDPRKSPDGAKGRTREESESVVDLGDAKRQKSRQRELPLETRGEAPKVGGSGEASTAVHGDERSGTSDARLMERVVERGNVVAALKRVQKNKGSPGIDGMTVGALRDHLRQVLAGAPRAAARGNVQTYAGEASAHP